MSNEYLESREPSPEEILDADSSYQKMQDEIDRHWWGKQDREAENKSLQKHNDFLKERL